MSIRTRWLVEEHLVRIQERRAGSVKAPHVKSEEHLSRAQDSGQARDTRAALCGDLS
jgi:hypothetical protein